MPFKFDRLAIPEIVVITPEVFSDDRGFFAETYKYSDFAAFGIKERFVQDNYSCSVQGVLRGLHYQRHPKAQGKLVQVIFGEIFDVAVDIRKGSPTYGKWVEITLSAEKMQMLYIPAGFAHGFCVLSEKADVVYKTTEEYSPEHDTGIIWDDPKVGIHWPVKQPIVSVRDAGLPFL
ncbi:dTDP-4-dehydrorhamnose 3,5-epimerase [candidate division NPL-UPA2 bacterium Unc8]|uniref:dTDP-4-dehydrorhamnose 3,5-epimerase n=1 Tax=candidate division NPL-UPA2 bacterium Unc8 TaxID=1980939 RepID=A0A399FWI2_UNCN2|nr:dTDP-4-dehydrorhamnose 3,5-epimerase [Bacillota bacterium]MBT9148358.1 dTDP-4-dehydrorhamnose 3,5-epimerase [Bacillota bacterium]RIH99855.1 MAG: dTDP-4-dehydrorhamnose 3,5-epimerase [candidate division NPL-UPA2 bacterium Unc8]